MRAAVAERRTANCPANARLASYSPRKWWTGITWRDHHDHCHSHILGQLGLALRTSFSGLFVRSQIDWFKRDKIGGWLTLAAGNCSLEQRNSDEYQNGRRENRSVTVGATATARHHSHSSTPHTMCVFKLCLARGGNFKCPLLRENLSIFGRLMSATPTNFPIIATVLTSWLSR